MKTLLLATTCLVALEVSTSAQTATATFLDVAGKEIGTAMLAPMTT